MLYHGDCLDIMPTLPDQSIDLILTDPPYGTTACKWDSIIPFEPMWTQLKRLIKPRGAIVLFGSQPFTSALVMSNVEWFKYEWVWEKEQGVNHLNAKIQPLKSHENISVFGNGTTTFYRQIEKGTSYKTKKSGNVVRNGKVYGHAYGYSIKNNGTRNPKTILRFNTERGLHPTQKPVALMEYLIKTYTNEGETVLDFTMGSGTTGVACANTGREFIGIELDAGYFEIATKRINEAITAPKQLELV